MCDMWQLFEGSYYCSRVATIRTNMVLCILNIYINNIHDIVGMLQLLQVAYLLLSSDILHDVISHFQLPLSVIISTINALNKLELSRAHIPRVLSICGFLQR